MKYYLGVDGGGTKTLFECYDENGKLVAQVKLPTCHLLQVSMDQARECLQTGVNQIKSAIAFKPQSDQLSIGLGLAGYGANADLRQAIEQMCQLALKGERYHIWNDAEIALYGGLNGQDGLLLIAGTGSIVLAKEGNHFYRSGGWGYLLGDEGSAYWLAKQLLNHFTRQADGREARTRLYAYLMDYFHLDDAGEIIQLIARDYSSRTQLAKLAVLVSQLAESGDAVAIDIINQAAQELADLLLCHQDHFDQQPMPVVTIGGLIENNVLLQNRVTELIEPKFYLTKACYSPARGASLLVKEFYG
ncbi:N-acetylglucosamine kinase [Vaginisenegalia massiliensis]|uniref:N-acetylglucosamine kinase n=1 Tax=Vaginisenegalia massiliensis TaxID=2058294 RepID=UPI000F546DD1|nr:BadF/BadG/BcrA/BcrD ATPase family protein [Vaginisenegalia massiliensis]